MRLSIGSRKIAPMVTHDKAEKPDPNGNRQQRRAAKKLKKEKKA